jgi:hypothetical protein
MGDVSSETCWALHKQWNNKCWYTVASCWLFLYELFRNWSAYFTALWIFHHWRWWQHILSQTLVYIYRVFNLKVDCILIWVIYLLRFTTCYITQLTCIYSKCWKWCPFISMHLWTRFTMFLANFLSHLSFTSLMAWVIFIFKILNVSKKLCLQWA